MPTALLKPNTHLKVAYTVPRNRVIEYSVESSIPVDTYIFDAEGLKEFNDPSVKLLQSYYGGFTNRYSHHQEVELPFRGRWYLLIRNPSTDESAAVHYKVLA